MRFIFKQPNFELVENINLIIVYNPLFLNSLNLNSIKSFFIILKFFHYHTAILGNKNLILLSTIFLNKFYFKKIKWVGIIICDLK